MIAAIASVAILVSRDAIEYSITRYFQAFDSMESLDASIKNLSKNQDRATIYLVNELSAGRLRDKAYEIGFLASYFSESNRTAVLDEMRSVAGELATQGVLARMGVLHLLLGRSEGELSNKVVDTAAGILKIRQSVAERNIIFRISEKGVFQRYSDSTKNQISIEVVSGLVRKWLESGIKPDDKDLNEIGKMLKSVELSDSDSVERMKVLLKAME